MSVITKAIPKESRADQQRRLKYGRILGTIVDYQGKAIHTVTTRPKSSGVNGEKIWEAMYYVHTNRRMQYKFNSQERLMAWVKVLGLKLVVF